MPKHAPTSPWVPNHCQQCGADEWEECPDSCPTMQPTPTYLTSAPGAFPSAPAAESPTSRSSR
jgi:hypothetical protein